VGGGGRRSPAAAAGAAARLGLRGGPAGGSAGDAGGGSGGQEEEDDDDAPLGGDTLRSCIQGEGDPPDELLLAAVACAADGTVLRGVPVQQLREDDAIEELDLTHSGFGVTAARLLGLMLPATSLRSLTYATTFPYAQRWSAPTDSPQHPALPPCSQSLGKLARL